LFIKNINPDFVGNYDTFNDWRADTGREFTLSFWTEAIEPIFFLGGNVKALGNGGESSTAWHYGVLVFSELALPPFLPGGGGEEEHW